MGTSISQASPDTLNWRAVQATYRTPLPIDRVAREIWRAAMNDAEADWGRELVTPAVEICFALSGRELDSASAVETAGRAIARDLSASFSGELAKLALANAMAAPGGRDRFVRGMFEQVTEYLVSRDLAGFIGSRYRNATVGEANAFLDEVRGNVGERVQAIAADLRPDVAESWPGTVRAVVAGLSGRGADAR
jgi:hypothetical protein